MYKNNTNNKEDQVFEKILNYDCLKSADIIEVSGSERMGYLYLKRWVEEGKIKRYPFNLYSPIDPVLAQPRVSLLEAVCHLDEYTYLCEFTAAKFHGLNVPKDDCVYLASKKRFRELVFDGWTIKYKRYSIQEDCVVSGYARYSTYTQTVIDLINAFPKGMSWDAFLVFLSSVKVIRTHNVISILKEIENRNLNKKIGWLADTGLLKVDNPDDLMKYCIVHISRTKLILSQMSQESGVYDEKWRLMNPMY